jgi:hypothetical protein
MARSQEATRGMLALLGLGPPRWWLGFAGGLFAVLVAAVFGVVAIWRGDL